MTLKQERNNSVQFLRATGLIPVRLKEKQKAPTSDWDPRRIGDQDTEATIEWIQANPKINFGALFYGRYIDVDVDTNDSITSAALDYFLPTTNIMWGRKSKPRSHRAYFLHEDFNRDRYGAITRFSKDSLSVEIRGGKMESGFYTVLPGSEHPSGEIYQWAKGVDHSVSMSAISAEEFMRAYRLFMAATILAPYWIEGIRNDLVMALAGVMARIQSSSMTLSEEEEDIYIPELNDALELVAGICEVSADDPEDLNSRLKTVRQTWKKFDNDDSAKITGGKRLAELIGDDGPDVVQRLYAVLSDFSGLEEMEKLAEQFVVWYGQGVVIDMEMIKKGITTPWMDKTQIRNSLGSKSIHLSGKRVKLANIIFDLPIIERVDGLTFDPSSTEMLVEKKGGTWVNQWKGFEVEPSPQTVTKDEIKPFTDYMKSIVCNNDMEIYKWVMNWIASIFQEPADKPNTALVLVGVQGAGKSFLGERIIRPIIGDEHSTIMGGFNSQFNLLLDNKIFVQCDEAVHTYEKKIAKVVKDIITAKEVRIEPKGINAYIKPNHMRFLFTSNEEHAAVYIDPDSHERRFTVVEVSDKKANDVEYWDFMHKWAQMNLHKILRWFLDFKYDRDVVARPIATSAKRQIQRVGLDPEISWIMSRIKVGFPLDEGSHKHWWDAYHGNHITEEEKKLDTIVRTEWPNFVRLATLEEDLRQFLRSRGRTVFSGSLSATMKRMFPKDSLEYSHKIRGKYLDNRTMQMVDTRIRLYHFPSQEEIHEHLRMKYGDVIDDLVVEN